MPFHRFYIPRGLYTAEEKQALVKAITDVYTAKSPRAPLPPFYVVVNFINVEDGDFFVGGEKNNNFVRIVVHHLARHLQEHEKRDFMDRYEKAISPWTKDKGIDWEVQVSNQDPVLWNENGIQPPEMGSEAFKLWKEANKAVPY